MRTITAAVLALGLAACASTMTPDDSALGVTWQLTELEGRSAGNAANGSRASLTLGTDGRASGNAGCNQFGGSYTASGAQLSFSQLGMTRMYCEGFMDLETRYSAVLQRTTGWRMRASSLELLAGDDVVARFTRS